MLRTAMYRRHRGYVTIIIIIIIIFIYHAIIAFKKSLISVRTKIFWRFHKFLLRFTAYDLCTLNRVVKFVNVC